jgi:transposase
MQALYDCVAGLDVHKESVVACVRRLDRAGQPREEVRTFGTTTTDLLALLDWLKGEAVQQAAMESTGVYWKPVFNIVAAEIEVMLVNAQHIQHVPGRKTDVKDCQWIAQLLQAGLLKASFVPAEPIRELRDLTRQRTQLTAEKARTANRLQKVLEDANLKLTSVASNVLGVSSRAMIEALIAGETDPAKLANLARQGLRAKIPALTKALRGRVTAHHRFMLRLYMDHVGHLEGMIGRLSERITEIIAPFFETVERLKTIPGVKQNAAEVIVAETGGLDQRAFPTAEHLASWAGCVRATARVPASAARVVRRTATVG